MAITMIQMMARSGMFPVSVVLGIPASLCWVKSHKGFTGIKLQGGKEMIGAIAADIIGSVFKGAVSKERTFPCLLPGAIFRMTRS